MVLAIANVEKPVIAAVRAPVARIGWSIALACDLVVALDTAKFIQVFHNVGLVTDGGSHLLLDPDPRRPSGARDRLQRAQYPPPTHWRLDSSPGLYRMPNSNPQPSIWLCALAAGPPSHSVSPRNGSSP
jgi:hypothetical protein